MRKTALLTSLVLILGLAGLLQIASAKPGGYGWVVLCHRTESSRPGRQFVLIVVGAPATTVNGFHGGHHETGSPPGHQGDVYLDTTVFSSASHQAALEFARENRHNVGLCVSKVPGVPGVPGAPPAQAKPGVAPVTG